MPHCHGHNCQGGYGGHRGHCPQNCHGEYYGGHRGRCHAGGCESWHDGPHPRDLTQTHESVYLSDEEPNDNVTRALKDLQKLVSTLSKKIAALEKK